MNFDQEKLNKTDFYPQTIDEVMNEYRKSLEQAKFGMCGDSFQCNFFNYENPGLRIRIPYAGIRLIWDFLLDARNPYRLPDILFGWAHADFDPPLMSLPSLELWNRSAYSDNPWILLSNSGRPATLATLMITLIAELCAAYRTYSIEQLRSNAHLWPGTNRFLAALAQLQANGQFEPSDLELFLNHSAPLAAIRLAVNSNSSNAGGSGSSNGGSDPATATNGTRGLPADVLLQLQIRLPFHIAASADRSRATSSGSLHNLPPPSPSKSSASANEELCPRPVLRLCFKSLDPLRYTANLVSNARLERALHASAAELQALVPRPPVPVAGGVQWLSFGIVDLVENVLGAFYARTDKLQEAVRARRAFVQELLAQHQGAVIEYDAETCLTVSFLFEINDFFFIFTVRLPGDFPHPREPPQLLLQSVYHERMPPSPSSSNQSQSSGAARASTAPAPALAVFRDCPYSPRWSPRELAARLLSYAHDCGVNFYNDTHALPFV